MLSHGQSQNNTRLLVSYEVMLSEILMNGKKSYSQASLSSFNQVASLGRNSEELCYHHYDGNMLNK